MKLKPPSLGSESIVTQRIFSMQNLQIFILKRSLNCICFQKHSHRTQNIYDSHVCCHLEGTNHEIAYVFNQRLTQWTEHIVRDQVMEGNPVFQPPQHSAPGTCSHRSQVEASCCPLGNLLTSCQGRDNYRIRAGRLLVSYDPTQRTS